MVEYTSEVILEIPIKLFKQKLHPTELVEFNNKINQRAREGWELVTYTFMGGDGMAVQTILATFKREKNDNQPISSIYRIDSFTYVTREYFRGFTEWE